MVFGYKTIVEYIIAKSNEETKLCAGTAQISISPNDLVDERGGVSKQAFIIGCGLPWTSAEVYEAGDVMCEEMIAIRDHLHKHCWNPEWLDCVLDAEQCISGQQPRLFGDLERV
ncbi:hypothetical protein EON63_09090 [archaeon]|nr:MAG: hypothetical protein EON63_09090 [archaeon]